MTALGYGLFRQRRFHSYPSKLSLWVRGGIQGSQTDRLQLQMPLPSPLATCSGSPAFPCWRDDSGCSRARAQPKSSVKSTHSSDYVHSIYALQGSYCSSPEAQPETMHVPDRFPKRREVESCPQAYASWPVDSHAFPSMPFASQRVHLRNNRVGKRLATLGTGKPPVVLVGVNLCVPQRSRARSRGTGSRSRGIGALAPPGQVVHATAKLGLANRVLRSTSRA